jgi:hypothetical protein
MGTWGTGLYSGDFAMDLRSTIGAVARLPFDGDRLVEILCEAEPGAANNSNDEEHTIFWLVVADQFARRAIACARVREKALTIIDGGSDLAMHAKLGMSPADLKKRQKALAEVRARLTVATADSVKPRPILKRPQPFLMDVGECLIYPTSGKDCINSYYSSKDKIPGWKHEGWSTMVVVDRGRAFDFLTWYTPVTISAPTAEKPTFAMLRSITPWILRRSGTCSAVHFKRLELERIGSLMIDHDKLIRAFPTMKPGTSSAIDDISITNSLGLLREVPPVLPALGKPARSIHGTPIFMISHLDDIVAD